MIFNVGIYSLNDDFLYRRIPTKITIKSHKTRKYSPIPIQKWMNWRLNRLKATTPAPINHHKR
ncbi:TPA: hypothetical protein DCZ39_03785 [Patescibacteria group bacterium]|nr:hypothetical protein [Candidatus Gracilibacteria bacterium]